jgi:peroxiredoxin 2/4
MKMVKIGKSAPKWSATVYDNGEKNTLDSRSLAGHWYVIYWWPFDFSGICNTEVLGFQKLSKDFEAAGITLIGASCDTFYSHKQWFENTSDFDEDSRPTHKIIADNTHKVSKSFGVFNKAIGCAVRATVLVNPEGEVMSFGMNHLAVSREPGEFLTTAIAFKAGGACNLDSRRALRA